jgi:hypothetical protein
LNGEAVLWEFPDIDLADALCLLLDLDAASPHVLAMPLDRLQLPDERRSALAPLIKARLQNERPSEQVKDRIVRRGLRWCGRRRLTRVTSDVARNFSEFAAFDLSMKRTDQRRAHRSARCHRGDRGRRRLHQVRDRSWRESNQILASSRRRLRARFRRLRSCFAPAGGRPPHTRSRSYKSSQPRCTRRVRMSRRQCVKCWFASAVTSSSFASQDLSSTPDGRARAAAIIAVSGAALVPAWLELLDGQTERARARQLVPLMSECAPSIAPAIAERLPLLNVDAACAALTVLATAGAGYEDLIAEQVKSGEERRAREAMRALARIGSQRAATLIAKQIEDGPPVARPAAEEALWRLPQPLAFAKTHELLRRRDFVVHHPHAATRLLERAAQSADLGLNPVLEKLTVAAFPFLESGGRTASAPRHESCGSDPGTSLRRASAS